MKNAQYSVPTVAVFSLAEWSKAVRKRDGNRCVECGSANKLHAHHIIPKSICAERKLDVSNGITLCIDCHIAAHERMGDASSTTLLRNSLLGKAPQNRGKNKSSQRKGPLWKPSLSSRIAGCMTADDFNAWLDAMAISGLEAHRRLGVSKDTITKYKREGAPTHIGLACSALYHKLPEWEGSRYDD